MSKNILMIAFHYPPVLGSSGVHRTLKFTEYLQEYGWHPFVLTVNPVAYLNKSDDQLSSIPENVLVKRAFALDTARHLTVGKAYLSFMALPDRWASWWFAGVFSAVRMIRKHKIRVMWSTYPIATAHLIGLAVHRITGIPWVADFRDSMTEETYPTDKRQRKIYQWIEKKVIQYCSYAVFTTPGARQMYLDRYPDMPKEKFVEIANGFDEEAFQAALQKPGETPQADEDRLVLLHSGILYPSERDPREFFAALADILQARDGVLDKVEIRLRATGHDEYLQSLIDDFGIQDVVKLYPSLPYSKALEEMLVVDGLLLLQASNCNHQIPAKVYEYLRAQKPVLALTDLSGDTARVLQEAGAGILTPLDDRQAIKKDFLHFLAELRDERVPILSASDVQQFSRKQKTRELARLLDELVS